MFAVEMHHITKSFRGVIANDSVNLNIRPRSIHALVGENGAGKTTLMRILYGMYQPENGSITIDGTRAIISNPSDAIALGIGMVHQHFMLIPQFTVTENIMLGQEQIRKFRRLDLKKAEQIVSQLTEKHHLNINPTAFVKELSVGLQQRVEILKILYHSANILILDEPTAVLTPQETDELFMTLKNLREEGKTIIIITHKLNEIMNVSDTITVMRRGKVVFESATAETSSAEISRQMIGRELQSSPERYSFGSSEEILTVEHLFLYDQSKSPILKYLSFSVHEGEILGIAGVEGNGQSQLVEVLAGLRKVSNGSLTLGGEDLSITSSAQTIGHIPEDRQARGLVLDFSIAENFVLGRQREKAFNNAFSLDYRRIMSCSTEMMSQYDVRASSAQQLVRGLSGGNQQKIVVGRELTKESDLIIANQPTRGLDVGATEFVHRSLLAKRNAGKALLLISSDLSELLTLADRIAVMFKGEIVATLDARTCTEYDLGLYMTGVQKRSA